LAMLAGVALVLKVSDISTRETDLAA
jgi:hypothetical protein